MRAPYRLLLALAALPLLGASCGEKKAPAANDPGPPIGFQTAKPADPAAPAPTPTNTAPPEAAPAGEEPAQPVAGKPDPKRVDGLLAKLASPCGKAHSLQKSIDTDKTCKRSPFAKKYVELLVSLGANDEEVTQLYDARYAQPKTYEFDLRETPFIGKPNAPVQLTMFFDYNCPHCRDKDPIVEEMVKKYPDSVVVYFKNFPLQNNKDSPAASASALAANRQGKFLEMHHALFQNQGVHDKGSLLRYAKEIGLDVRKFAADLADPKVTGRVESDRQEGVKADIKGTPTLYVNGRTYSDPIILDILASWIDEELAVNR
jgi:protein-disulfide isomerase